MTTDEHFRLAKNKAKQYGISLERSTHVDKKYMFVHPLLDTYVHFGAAGYEDYLSHRDKARRERYRKRHSYLLNSRGYPAYKEKYSPAWASYNILW